MAASGGADMDRPSVAPPGARPRANLYGLEREELASVLSPFATRPFQAAQIYHWIYGRQETDPAAMTDLPASLRGALQERFVVSWPSIKEARDSADGSRKYVLALRDGGEVEAVYILYGERVTLCLSSQIGCPLACRFCLTGTMGQVRNLTPGEILGQIAVIARDNALAGTSYRVVFMGMGEPLLNLDAVMGAFRVMVDRKGFALSPRR